MKELLKWRPHKYKIAYWILTLFYLCFAVLFLILGITRMEDISIYLILVLLWLVCAGRELYYLKKDFPS